MANDENSKPRKPRLTPTRKSEIAGAVAERLLSDKKFLESTADKLLASEPFTRRIIVTLLLVGLFSAAIYAGVAFLSFRSAISHTNNYLTNQFAIYIKTNDLEIAQRLLAALKEVTNQITREFESERIKEIVSDVASNRANAILTVQLLPEVDRFRKSITNEVRLIAQSVFELTNASLFAITLLAANADDRTAFNMIRRWAEDTNFLYRAEAFRAEQAIIDHHNLTASTPLTYLPPWGTNPDPMLPLNELKEVWRNTPLREVRAGLLQRTRNEKISLDMIRLGFLSL